MKHLQLHGVLADKFGEHWHLDVRNPAEALRAVAANHPTFLTHLIASQDEGVGYRVIIGERDAALNQLGDPSGTETIHLVPVISGAKDGLGGILIGGLLIAGAVASGGAGMGLISAYDAGFAASGLTGGLSMAAGSLAWSIGVSLVLGGVSQMLAGNPASDNSMQSTTGEGLPSYHFNGPSNRMKEGGPVPLGYGRMIVGAMPISAGISTEAVTT